MSSYQLLKSILLLYQMVLISTLVHMYILVEDTSD